MNKTDLQVCEAISLRTMCLNFCQDVGKLLFRRCQDCPNWIQNFGVKMMEIKVVEINAALNYQRGN